MKHITIDTTGQAITLADVNQKIEGSELSTTQARDMISAVMRICAMAGLAPSALEADVAGLRVVLSKIRPAAHGIAPKTFSNLRSLFVAALGNAGIVDAMPRGVAGGHPVWAPLIKAIAWDKRLSNGLAAFGNWCAVNGIAPEDVDDDILQRFLAWLEARTLHPKPRDLVRRVPNVWNDARKKVPGWPQIALTRLSFKHRAKDCRHRHRCRGWQIQPRTRRSARSAREPAGRTARPLEGSAAICDTPASTALGHLRGESSSPRGVLERS